MTVSRVLNNAPHVSSTTRRRVLVAAERLGYRPDPQITQLMSRVRGYRRHRSETVIAVVRDAIPGDELHDPAYQYVTIADIRLNVERHGYRAEEFHLGQGGVTARRMSDILRSRGIEGLLISPQSSANLAEALDYKYFATATFGFGLKQPALHRASTNMTRGILQATAELTARGYRRIGLAITHWIDARSDRTYSGAMLNYQRQIPARDRVPMLLFPENNLANEAAIFCAWCRRHHPDVVISFDSYVPDWMTKKLGLKIPDDIGLVVHDWVERHADFAGIHHRRRHVVAAAVDLLVGQLMHNERGIPEVPRQVLIPPSWIDGSSIRHA